MLIIGKNKTDKYRFSGRIKRFAISVKATGAENEIIAPLTNSGRSYSL